MGYHQHQFTMGLGEVIARLGQQTGPRGDRKTCWQIRYVEQLIASAGFPAPLPLLSGDGLVESVKPASRWPIAAVELWFDDRGPAGPAAADRARQRAADAEMDARAAQLGLSIIAGGRA